MSALTERPNGSILIWPAYAQAVIFAELREDQSDSQTDYFGSRVQARVFLAWSTHQRDLFSEMRKAAELFAPTHHLGRSCGNFLAQVVCAEDFISNGSAYYKGCVSPWHDDLYGVTDRASRYGRECLTRAEAETFISLAPSADPIVIDGISRSFTWTIKGGTQAIEHREKYSMGGGFYLKRGSRHSSGWSVRKSPAGLAVTDGMLTPEEWEAR